MKNYSNRQPKKATKSEPSQRQYRVGEQIRHILSDLLVRDVLQNEELSRVSVTITEVRPSPDLKYVKVFVMPLGGKYVDEAVAALNSASGALRHQLGKVLHLKFIPALRFVPDLSYDAASHINKLLHLPRVAQDLDSHDSE